jgi:hypothetical protein
VQDEEIQSVIDDLLAAVKVRTEQLMPLGLKALGPRWVLPEFFPWGLTKRLAAHTSELETVSRSKAGRTGATKRKDIANNIEKTADDIERTNGDFHLSPFWNLYDVYSLRGDWPADSAGASRQEIGEIDDEHILLAGKRQELYDYSRLPSILRKYASRLRHPVGPAIRQRHSHALTRLSEMAVCRFIRETTGAPRLRECVVLLRAAEALSRRASRTDSGRPAKAGRTKRTSMERQMRALQARWERYLKEVPRF